MSSMNESQSNSVAYERRWWVLAVLAISVFLVVVDNLIANARKARANRVTFTITHPTKNSVHVRVTDNGRGFSDQIDDLDRVFEKGFTKTDGSGLGLYHVRQVLGEMNGTIEAQKIDGQRGATFLIRIAK